jgi:hypothetical protein
VAGEQATYRVELLAVVNLTELRKWRATDTTMPDDPLIWDAWGLFRGIGFGLVSKWNSQLLAIEEVQPEPEDTEESQPSQEE